MKKLLTIVILLCALTTHAQNRFRATVQPDTFSTSIDLGNAPNSSWNTVESPRYPYRRARRPRGTITTIVGVGLVAGGLALLTTTNDIGTSYLGLALFADGIVVALIGGAIMGNDMLNRPHPSHRYSLVIHPKGLGLAYNF